MAIELSEQEQLRRQSLQALRDLGIEPYPAARYEVTATAREIAENYENLKNYCKYIYHEVSLIHEYEKSGILNRSTAKKYVQLIQAQMNNYELFCYLLNQFDYYYNGEKGRVNRNHLEKYFRYLKKNEFFKDLKASLSFERQVKVLEDAAHLGDKAPL